MGWTAPETWSVNEVMGATKMNTNLRDNLKAMAPVHYSEATADVTVTGTTSGAPTTVLAGAAVTYEARPILVEFFCPGLDSSSNGTLYLGLYDSTTLVSQLLFRLVAAGFDYDSPIYLRHRFTPNAGSHTYAVKGWRATADMTVKAGTGTSGAILPASLRIRYDEF